MNITCAVLRPAATFAAAGGAGHTLQVQVHRVAVTSTAAGKKMLPSINSNDLIRLLEQQLQQLEEMQGEVDPEARKKLREFKAAAAAAASTGASHLGSEEQIATQLDSVAEQLEEVEKDLAALDPAARQLVGASASTWLQPEATDVLRVSQAVNKADAPQ